MLVRKLVGISAVVSLLALCGLAPAQSFNVDLDTTGGSAGSGVPASSYGGGAGQAGGWNSVRSSMPQTTALVGLNGAATSATFTRAFNGQFVNLNGAFTTSGNFEKLVDDIMTTGDTLESMTFSFNNLQAGTYVVYTYAMHAEFPNQQTWVTVNGSFGQVQQACGGSPLDGNRAIPGKVYAAHGVTIGAGRTITILLQSNDSQPVKVGGFQLKRLPDAQRNRMYVSNNTNGDGGSWGDGMADLQDALEAARRISGAICEIWVGKGTYKPTSGSDRNASFVIPTNLVLYGGFFGNEATLAERTFPAFNITNLSGSIGAATTADNSYHVMRMNSAGGATIVDGFTISQGTANGSGDNANGGGVLMINSSATFRNTKFINNRASIKGGGVSIQGGTPRFGRCLFYNNSVTNGTGGGVALGGGASATVRFANCEFLANDALGDGGGFYTLAQPAEFVNCVFNANAALASQSSHGGAIYAALSGANVTLRHCTLVNNTAGTSGGGLAVSTNGVITATNTILWANSDNTGGTVASQQAATVAGTGTLSFPWTWVQGVNPNPQFVNLNGPDGIPGNFDDNLRLMATSPCVDTGNNFYLATDSLDLDGDGNSVETLPVDFDGKTRVVDVPGVGPNGAIVDFGAFEVQLPPCTGDINGDGKVDAIDLGMLLSGFGCASGCGSTDLTGNGIVDAEDLGVLLSVFGQICQ